MEKAAVRVFNLRGEAVGEVSLSSVFKTPIREGLIKRVVVALQSHRFQPQGRDRMAGKRTTAESWGVGHGRSRVPRVKGTDRAAFAPGTVGGRIAHPPTVEKIIRKEVPKKERRLAIRSAVAATALKEVVAKRGHVVNNVLELPLVVTDDIQRLTRTKDVKEAFERLGVWPDVCRAKEGRRVRSGKGKMRGRKYKRAVGPLLVIMEDQGIVKASRNLPGVNVVNVKDLNAELLAPGARLGRLTIWARSAFEKVDELFGGD